MEEDSKKEIERFYLTKFLELVPSLEHSKLKCSERPDFILTQQNQKIGIEVTTIYHDSYKGQSFVKLQESLQEKVAQNVANKLDSYLHYSVQMNIEFHKEVAKERLNKIVKGCVNTILHNLSQLNTSQRLDILHIYKSELLPDEVASIHIYYHKNMEETIGFKGRGGLVPSLQSFQVQDILSKKEEKLSNYQSCDKYWLVIVEKPEFASIFDSCQEVLETSFSSSFDKVFLFRGLNEIYYELKLSSVL